jgi:hypothetical protein
VNSNTGAIVVGGAAVVTVVVLAVLVVGGITAAIGVVVVITTVEGGASSTVLETLAGGLGAAPSRPSEPQADNVQASVNVTSAGAQVLGLRSANTPFRFVDGRRDEAASRGAGCRD